VRQKAKQEGISYQKDIRRAVEKSLTSVSSELVCFRWAKPEFSFKMPHHEYEGFEEASVDSRLNATNRIPHPAKRRPNDLGFSRTPIAMVQTTDMR
jgi:hypothetical protein